MSFLKVLLIRAVQYSYQQGMEPNYGVAISHSPNK